MRHPTSVRIIISVLLTFVFGGAFAAYAGSLTPSASPAATMNTVAEVYNAVASTTFDSSAISASSTGSLVQILKNISANLGWSVSSNNLSNSNSGTVAIDSSDWDISTTGAITGVAFDANGTGNTLTNVDNGDLTADTLDFTAIADSTALDADTAIAAGTGEELTYTKSFTNATSENGLVMSFTALDTTSGTTAQYGLYLDNVASTEGADALLVLDNSDTDDIITAAIKIIDAGGGFTTLLDNAGTLISGAEFNVLDGGITHGEITDSGTLTVTTADINGGNIDGTTIGATTAGAITGTAITGTSFVIGANTLTTSEWAFLDGQNQAVLTTSNPTFGNLTITSFAANWTNAGRTVADLGIVTTADINGGTLDGATIGGSSAGAGTFTTLAASTGGNLLTLTNTTDGASVQDAIIQGDRATMADNDEAYVTLRLSNDLGTQTEFARLTWVATDVNNGTSEDGRLDFAVMTAGSLADELQIDGSALSPSSDGGIALGTTALGYNGLHLNTGTAINWENSDVTLTHASNALTLDGGDLFVANGNGTIIGHTAQLTVGGAISEVQILGTGQTDTAALVAGFSADAFGPSLQFTKSRNATIGTSTIVLDNDALGGINWYPADGTDFANLSAAFFAEVEDGSPAENDIGTAFVWQQQGGGGVALRETMRLSAAGTLTPLGAVIESQGTDIASASTIVIPTDGNSFELTGTTGVTLITTTGWRDGFRVTLFANESVTITHGTATSGANVTILLSGAANYSMTANDSLTLELSTTTAGGRAWREVSRTVI